MEISDSYYFTMLSSKTTAWNEFSSTMASAIICLATNQKFNFSKYIFESMVRNLDNLSGKFLMYPRFVQVFLDKQLDGRPNHKKVYIAPSHTKKIFGNMRRVGKGFSGRVTPLFPTMVVQNQSELGEGSAMPTDPHHTPIIIESSTQLQKTQKPRKPKRKDTQVLQPSDPTDIVADEAVHKELGDRLVRATTTASSLEAKQDSGNITKTRSKATPNESSSLGTTSGGGPRCQETIRDTIAQTRFENVSNFLKIQMLTRVKTTQQNEIDSLKRRVKKLEKKRSSRTHKMKRLNKVGLTARVESSGDEESLGEDASKQGRKINAIDADEDITLVNVQDDADNEMFDVNILNGEEVFVAAQNENVVEEVVDAAQEEPPLNPMEKKLKSMLDEEVALKLQAEFDEEERLAREKHSKRVNILEDFRTELVKGKEKRAGEELIQEGLKKQKVDDDKETIKLKQCLKIIPDKEEVTIDAIPLAVKSNHMLKSFSMEDLEDLYKLVKAKYKSTRPVEDLDLLLLGDLKTMFEPHVEDTVWRNQQDYSIRLEAVWILWSTFLEDATCAYSYVGREEGRIIRIKSLLDAVRITAAQVYVNTALMKLVLLRDFKENMLNSGIPADSLQTPILTQLSSSRSQKKQSKRKQRKDNAVTQEEPQQDDSVPTPSNDPPLSDAEVTLVNETQERQDEDLMFDTRVMDSDEIFVDDTTGEKDEQSTNIDDSTIGEAITTAGVEDSDAPTIPTIVEETLAQTLMKIKVAKPKAKGIVFHDLEKQVSKPTVSVTQPSIKDKGKGIIQEPERHLTKKDQVALDEDLARNIQAQLDAEIIEEERLERQKQEEANIPLIESWENT
ncbi:hypothetical protein Tco_1524525 [Tanacetum coccineum]